EAEFAAERAPGREDRKRAECRIELESGRVEFDRIVRAETGGVDVADDTDHAAGDQGVDIAHREDQCAVRSFDGAASLRAGDIEIADYHVDRRRGIPASYSLDLIAGTPAELGVVQGIAGPREAVADQGLQAIGRNQGNDAAGLDS